MGTNARGGGRFLAGSGSAPLWIAIAAAGALPLFWPGILSLFDAWQRPEYSHGYVIPLVAGWLYLRSVSKSAETRRLAAGARPGWMGLALIALGVAGGLLGGAARIPDIVTYGMIVWIFGISLTLLGPREGLRHWAPILYLAFMLPLPNFIYWPLSMRLQLMSSEIGVGLIAWFGVPVYLDGNVIDLGIYKLQVAEACNGLRYLFPLMSFGFLFAMLYRGPLWQKAILFLSTIPVTVLMNSWRIGVIGVLVDRFGISQAEGFLHVFEGWIIFAGCVGVLLAEALLLHRMLPARARPGGMLDFDPGRPGRALALLGSARAPAGLIAGAVATLLAAGAWHAANERPAAPAPREPLVLFPKSLSGWKGREIHLDSAMRRVLAADEYHYATYAAAEATRPVNLFIAYYEKQVEGSGIHSPEICIPAGGWEVLIWEPWTTAAGGIDLMVNRAIIQKGLERQLVYYWFDQRGRRLTNEYAVKAYTVWDSMTRGRTDGALVRLVTQLAPEESPADGDRRLAGFLDLLLPALPRFLPD